MSRSMSRVILLKRLLAFIFISIVAHCNDIAKTKVYKPDEIHITKSTTEGSYPTSPIKYTATDETKCVKSAAEVELGTTDQVKFKYIDIDGNAVSEGLTKHESSSTGSTGSTTNVAVKLLTTKTKSIVFTVNNVYKALLVGGTEDECFKKYLITQEEKDKQYVQLTYIKCFPLAEVEDYKKKTTKEDKNFVLGTKHLCFLPSLLSKPICLTVNEKTKSYSIIISPYPEPSPKCTTPKSKTCPVAPANATTNGTETAKQSATPIIISVVVIVVVIIAGGVGYVMMKK